MFIRNRKRYIFYVLVFFTLYAIILWRPSLSSSKKETEMTLTQTYLHDNSFASEKAKLEAYQDVFHQEFQEMQKLVRHPRPENIPTQAFWTGGYDGGSYTEIEILDAENFLAYVKSYDEFDGSLGYSGRAFFVPKTNIGNLNLIDLISPKFAFSSWSYDHMNFVYGDLVALDSVENDRRIQKEFEKQSETNGTQKP